MIPCHFEDIIYLSASEIRLENSVTKITKVGKGTVTYSWNENIITPIICTLSMLYLYVALFAVRY